ncbi:hypothetical protein M0805_005060 [Coniferiporia weirii]|nr:hypothetical protein M0805_005060 [Coniferiporia weirii]
MSDASGSPQKSFAEIARIVALQLSRQRGAPLRVLGDGGNVGASQVLPRLYLGDFNDASDESELIRLRVTHVLSVLETPPSFDFKSGHGTTLKKLHLPMKDSFAANIHRHFDTSTSFIREALAEPDSVVLVHCLQGISRSATIVAAYLLASLSNFNSADDVLRFLKEKRSVVFPNHGFVRQLNEYATTCALRRSEFKPTQDVGLHAERELVGAKAADSNDVIVQADTLQFGTVS